MFSLSMPSWLTKSLKFTSNFTNILAFMQAKMSSRFIAFSSARFFNLHPASMNRSFLQVWTCGLHTRAAFSTTNKPGSKPGKLRQVGAYCERACMWYLQRGRAICAPNASLKKGGVPSGLLGHSVDNTGNKVGQRPPPVFAKQVV